MANILTFSRNRFVNVEQLDEETMRSSCGLHDTLTDAFVEISVQIPHLEIKSACGNITRSIRREEMDVAATLQKIIGVRIGPGMNKIIKGLLGDSDYGRKLAVLIEECCNGVILNFTKEVLLSAPKDTSREKEYFENMVRSNPRLYNSCAALAPGSPLVEDIEPE